MTRPEALREIEQLLAAHSLTTPITEEEVLCHEMKTAAKILSGAFAELRDFGGLNRNRQRRGILPPPPGRVPPA